MWNVLAFVMAGGRGTRLMPLTMDRAKPAVSFGGIYRLIDFTLSNCVNSQIYKIVVLPQYKSQTLNEHLEIGWDIFSHKMGHFLKIVPPQQMLGPDWYRGTADCIRQNLNIIEQIKPDHVLILSGDHIYKMNYALLLDYHLEKKADVTMSLLEVDKNIADQVGVAAVDNDLKIIGFQEKPTGNVKTIPDDPGHVLASMGIYIFRTDTLMSCLKSSSLDDFGSDIIPQMLNSASVYAYPYGRFNRIEDYIYETQENGKRNLKLASRTRDSSYWRDVGTLDSYWNANMDLTGVAPYFNLYGAKWPIHTNQILAPPAKFVFKDAAADRIGHALDSLVSPGCIISGLVSDSVLAYNVVVQSWATVEESVISDGVLVGRYSKIKKAIIAEDNFIPPHTMIGYNPKEDMKRFIVTPRGIVVVPRGYFKP